MYNPGDRLRCIDSGHHTQLEEGKVYVVRADQQQYGRGVRIAGEEHEGNAYHEWRFKKAAGKWWKESA